MDCTVCLRSDYHIEGHLNSIGEYSHVWFSCSLVCRVQLVNPVIRTRETEEELGQLEDRLAIPQTSKLFLFALLLNFVYTV